MAARHVPREVKPTARFIPLASVSPMMPASATQPDAVTCGGCGDRQSRQQQDEWRDVTRTGRQSR
jgi:hypothetical protein